MGTESKSNIPCCALLLRSVPAIYSRRGYDSTGLSSVAPPWAAPPRKITTELDFNGQTFINLSISLRRLCQKLKKNKGWTGWNHTTSMLKPTLYNCLLLTGDERNRKRVENVRISSFIRRCNVTTRLGTADVFYWVSWRTRLLHWRQAHQTAFFTVLFSTFLQFSKLQGRYRSPPKIYTCSNRFITLFPPLFYETVGRTSQSHTQKSYGDCRPFSRENGLRMEKTATTRIVPPSRVRGTLRVDALRGGGVR
jgi:hypothetical protein